MTSDRNEGLQTSEFLLRNGCFDVPTALAEQNKL